MGLLSGIGKAIKKVFKGVGKVFKAIGKGVKKLFSSAFGKVLLVAATVFFGGMALGLWASPFATTAAAGSTAAGTAMAAETVTGVGLAETAGLSAHMGAAGAAGAAGGSAVAGASVGGGVGTAAGTMTTMPIAEATATSAAGLGGATGSAAGEFLVHLPSTPAQWAAAGKMGATAPSLFGTVTGAAKSAGAWMEAHPMLTMMGGNMLSSMFTPSKAEEEIEVEEWKRENSTIAGIGYDGSGSGIDFSKMKGMSGRYNMSSPLPYGPTAQLKSAANYAKSSYDPDYYNREEEKRKRNAGLLKQNMTGG